jgi:flagellar biosynthesis GTPase FlhF
VEHPIVGAIRPDGSSRCSGVARAAIPQSPIQARRLGASSFRARPTLICREDELSTLEDALLEAARGEGRVVLLTGDAGVGKTRVAAGLRGRPPRRRKEST